MSISHHIVDEQLPLSQDFKLLKEEGLAFIQDKMGNEWTNLNPGDPGVTILDQLCFALTELGYCNDFPLRDILTAADGKLRIKDQFYLPEDILTTSPVTIEDYRKYVIDGVDGVNNIVVVPLNGVIGVYQSYLLIDPAIKDSKKIDVCMSAFFYLNKSRNINELFLLPAPLEEVRSLIRGSICLESANDLSSVLAKCEEAIRNYIFPKVSPAGYGQLVADGIEPDKIFNGPLLQNGWIQTSSLGEKKNLLRAIELQTLLESVPGVVYASGIGFVHGAVTKSDVSFGDYQMLSVDMFTSVNNKELKVYIKNEEYKFKDDLKPPPTSVESPLSDSTILFGAALDIQTELPKGKYRDINTYYSIQNTFPEIFAVGADAIVSNASDFQIAQSRQLKGYLTLFDQLLANQFSQLANINRLFSFKNSMIGTPSDKKIFHDLKDEFERSHPEYPVPYLSFSPTYFYQSLYDVPHIRPLLKDNDAFKFSAEPESQKELERSSWSAYKLDPYNSYMRGLREFMEDESTSLDRRNDILDHLLARHGESPLIFNSIIEGSVYGGDNLKDKVIFKSLYLQNLGLLSYFRQKASGFISAYKISDTIGEVPVDFEEQILGADSIDFIFNSGKVNEIEKLHEQDFINYSALELKLSLLLGLKVQYRDYISYNYETAGTPGNTEDPENLKVAFWMVMQRCGVLFIERALLRQSGVFGTLTAGISDANEDFDIGVELIFPDFIPQFKTEQFKNRLDLLLQTTVPAHVPCTYYFVSCPQLQKLIPAFVRWHNSLIYQDKKQDKKYVYNEYIYNLKQIEAAEYLSTLLKQIKRV